MLRLLLFNIIIFFSHLAFPFGPFPIEGEIVDQHKQKIGTAKVYPRYIEIFNNQNLFIIKVGILIEDGLSKLFLVQNGTYKIVGHSSKGIIYNKDNNIVGKYVSTPTYSFIYNKEGQKVGSVKCIAWPRICAAGVGGYLLKLY